jgi:hypothetical protein
MAIKIQDITIIADTGAIENVTNFKTINGENILGTGGITVGNVITDSTQTLTNKTLSTGSTWEGGTIGVAYGGTGQTSFTNV